MTIYPIDDGIFDLIVNLNKAGYETSACCQGKTELGEEKHSSRAYIAFKDEFPKHIIDTLTKLDMYVYGILEDLRCVASISYPETDPVILIDANRSFQNKIRQAFNL
jgi:hypothetical protein